MEIHLMRHARTEWNAARRIQGQADIPLSGEGRAMAAEWAAGLAARHASAPYDLVVSSDLGRARETAGIVLEELGRLGPPPPLMIESRLREQDWGLWVGFLIDELRGKASGTAGCGDVLTRAEARGWDFRPPSGESRHDLLARVNAALADLPNAVRVLVVCHEGPIKAALYSRLGRRFTPDEPPVLTGYRLHALRRDAGGVHLDAINLDFAPVSGAASS